MAVSCVLTSDLPGILRIAGELDISALSGIIDALNQLDPYDDIYLDISDLAFMDSAGAHVLIYAAKLVEPRGRLVLIAPTRQVERVLSLSGTRDSIPNLEIVQAPRLPRRRQARI